MWMLGTDPRSLARAVSSSAAELSLQPQSWDFYLPGTIFHSRRLQGLCRLLPSLAIDVLCLLICPHLAAMCVVVSLLSGCPQ